MLHSVSPARVFSMRQQTQMLWSRYLSSVDKIVDTTFEVNINHLIPKVGLISLKNHILSQI